MNQTAVIFDLDGTLTKPHLDFDAIRTEIGMESGFILETIARMDAPDRQRAEAILRHHEQEAARNAVLHDGAAHVVATLRARGHPVAILTRNARETAGIVLDRHGILFDALRTRDDGAIKPSPEPVLSLCAELRAEPRSSWMVGDHLMDLQSGGKAGTHTVLMLGDRPTPDYADQADHVVRHLPDLLAIIR